MGKPRFLLWKTRAMATATLGWEHFGGNTSSGGAASPVLNVSRGRILTDSLDQPLVSRCLDGDEAAWEELVRQHTRQVYGLCFRFTNSAQEAQDLTQEVFLRAFKTIKTFRSTEGSFHTWLARVTRNLLIDHYRRTRQERVTDSIEEQLPMLEEAGGAAAVRPDQALAGREAAAILQATLQKLSPDLREAVILRDLQEMEYREIAEVLAIPEGTVKSRINRGRAELARLLRKQKLVV
jgi:RNA polymerase sigma-70 factor, ECF subfamily